MVAYTVYSVVMLDEAHERTLYTDIIVGLLKKVSVSVIVHVHNFVIIIMEVQTGSTLAYRTSSLRM